MRLAMQLGPPYRMAMAVACGFRQATATCFGGSELFWSTTVGGAGPQPRPFFAHDRMGNKWHRFDPQGGR